jgi:hypothetical protein
MDRLDTFRRFLKVPICSKGEGVFVIRASVIWKRDVTKRCSAQLMMLQPDAARRQ